jgi:hypothetical protein
VPGTVEPPLLWRAWIGHWFGLRPSDMHELYLHQYVEMHEFASRD